jgi:hypothetical protein
MLAAGIMSKASLWRNCELSLAGRPELAGVDFNALCQRADSQRERLESNRARIVDEAFGVAARAATVVRGLPNTPECSEGEEGVCGLR